MKGPIVQQLQWLWKVRRATIKKHGQNELSRALAQSIKLRVLTERMRQTVVS